MGYRSSIFFSGYVGYRSICFLGVYGILICKVSGDRWDIYPLSCLGVGGVQIYKLSGGRWDIDL